MKPENITNESLMAFYESVRRQVAAGTQLKSHYRLIGDGVKAYADELEAEMGRREIRFKPIHWPRH